MPKGDVEKSGSKSPNQPDTERVELEHFEIQTAVAHFDVQVRIEPPAHTEPEEVSQFIVRIAERKVDEFWLRKRRKGRQRTDDRESKRD